MLGHHAVHRVGEHDVRFPRGQPGFYQLLEQRARIDGGAHFAGFGRFEVKFGPVTHGFHEFIGQQHAVVEVQCLTVEIAAGLADFEELFDFRVANIKIARRRTAPQRTLRNRQRQAVHHAHKRDDPTGLAIEADRLTNPADIAPIGADPAALAGKPDVFVPGVDDPFKAVGHRIEVARNRQAAVGAAVRQHRSGGHEPQFRDVVIQPLGVGLIIGIGIGHAREQVLIILTGQQIAIGQRVLAEIGQPGIARCIGDDGKAAGVYLLAVGSTLRRFGPSLRERPGQRFASLGGDEFFRSGIRLVHGHSLFIPCGHLGPRLCLGRRACIQFVHHITRHIIARFEIHLLPHLSPESAAPARAMFQFCSIPAGPQTCQQGDP